jgi:glucosyl-dolichyl phosphate glucuronosyltransferase
MVYLASVAEREAQRLRAVEHRALTSASVILCTRDRAARLPATLSALGAMRVREGIEWEVLVIDNGSVDSTKNVIESFIRESHSRFRYVYEPSPGKTYALNRGIQKARGEILAFTDDDAIVEANWLEEIVKAFDRYSADGIGGKVIPIWEAERPAWLSDRFLNVLALLDYGNKSFQLTWGEPPHMLYGVNYAFRKSVFERVGGFNIILGTRGEDQEFFDRLKQVDARVFYEPSVVVRHVIPQERLTKAYFHRWHRASGWARAKLPPAAGRTVFGIPLYTLRKGFDTLRRLIVAGFSVDKEGAFEYTLRLEYFIAYYMGRISAVLRDVTI